MFLSYPMELKKGLLFLLLLECVFCDVESMCVKECDVALASYYILPGYLTVENVTGWLESSVLSNSDVIKSYNKDKIIKDNLPSFDRINVPFPCDCIHEEFLGHVFEYSAAAGDTYDSIAKVTYANLTTVELLTRFNSYGHDIPQNAKINVTVKCSCGNSQVSKDYGLFITYPLRPGNNLHDIANEVHLDAQLLEKYNPGVNFSKDSGIVFIPGRDQNGDYVPLYPRKAGGIKKKISAKDAAVGVSIAGICGLLLLVVCIYVKYLQKKEGEEVKLPTESSMAFSTQDASGSSEYETSGSSGPTTASATGLTGIMVAKSMEFSYQELAKATNNFSLENKIGQGGFGAVYYAELRGEKTAIKKMDVQASTEFLCELKVLTHVHHLNLVRLIGYCVEGSLFLVYEYIDNGNLGQYLHGTGKDPLPWSSRVQIALDSARGLEYIHEHTVPVYIHRDVKSANILIDKNFRGKVADFGLTKLIEVGGSTLHTRLVGTFGYMPPEYAQYGDVSPKVDVYAFGVVLYELISAKNAILRTGESVAETKGLVALFEEALNQSNPGEGIRKLVDPRLGENYPIDSVLKIAQLGRACTRDNPLLRPSMRSIVVALMTLSSPTEDCEDGASYENQTLINLLSVR
ncbi:lysM domain receptor-like kinase 3 isoform X2 [Cajanus cajan]|uniref:lysM domain receptor-like kinase 3 isoform X2 n=1 Tax=Cajanus cajan TaxID=3821 RepID=UPI0010FB7362|nr:lysM domain receptor-like kinase 3 isoform X2 [Cajanus cajan]